MSIEDSTSISRAAEDIRAARAQFEAIQHRQRRLIGGPAERLPKLARYTMVRELHRGGQGVVYLAGQESTDRPVAVKVLNRPPLSGADPALARVEREGEGLSLLKHPNVVTIHDCGRDHDRVYLVMDYVEGRDLDVYIRGERTPLRESIGLFIKVCDGGNA